MSPKKQKRSYNTNIDIEVSKLTRKPLYPVLHPEKENMEPFSSDDTFEKFSMKSNSPSSGNSIQDVSRSPKCRKRKDQQKLIDNQDIENPDVDMETDNPDTDCLYNQEQEEPEIFPDLSSNNYENSEDARRRLIQHAMPVQSVSDFSCYFSMKCACLFLIFTVPVILLITNWIGYPDTPYMNDQLNITIMVNSLKAEFKNQPPLTFRIIHSATKKILELQPKAPAIILLLATNGSKTICSEFAHRLVQLLSVPKHAVSISGNDYKQANTNHVKLEIDKAISNNLKNDQLGSVLIYDLDQIPGQAAMIFHKYYDHENAPFKKAVFVMTVNYNKTVSDDGKMWDKAANDHLLSVWTDIGVDQVTPLLARLTVSVAVIKA